VECDILKPDIDHLVFSLLHVFHPFHLVYVYSQQTLLKS